MELSVTDDAAFRCFPWSENLWLTFVVFLVSEDFFKTTFYYCPLRVFVIEQSQRNKIRKGSNSQCCLSQCAGKMKLLKTLQANCLLVYSFVFFRPPGEKCNGMNFTVCAFHAFCQGQSSIKSTVNNRASTVVLDLHNSLKPTTILLQIIYQQVPDIKL